MRRWRGRGRRRGRRRCRRGSGRGRLRRRRRGRRRLGSGRRRTGSSGGWGSRGGRRRRSGAGRRIGRAGLWGPGRGGGLPAGGSGRAVLGARDRALRAARRETDGDRRRCDLALHQPRHAARLCTRPGAARRRVDASSRGGGADGAVLRDDLGSRRRCRNRRRPLERVVRPDRAEEENGADRDRSGAESDHEVVPRAWQSPQPHSLPPKVSLRARISLARPPDDPSFECSAADGTLGCEARPNRPDWARSPRRGHAACVSRGRLGGDAQGG